MLKKRFFKTRDECEVTFEVSADEASQVDLFCEANGWEPIPMKKARKGPFRTRVRLPRDGEFEFRYLVDRTRWTNDDEADGFRANGFGSRNGVLSTLSNPSEPASTATSHN